MKPFTGKGSDPLSFGEGWGELTQAQQGFQAFIRTIMILNQRTCRNCQAKRTKDGLNNKVNDE